MTDTEVSSQQPEKTGQKRIDKLALNNQIVSMRKDVRRARLWLINNLNQRAKKLSEKKGDEQHKAKNSRRVQRLRSEMQILKHIDVDEVSKFALCSKIEPGDVVSELEKLEANQRAMLRLAYHKLVQARVTAFRKDNPVPIDRLILLIRALGLKYQKKKLVKKSKGDNMIAATSTNTKKTVPKAPAKEKLLKKTQKDSSEEEPGEKEDIIDSKIEPKQNEGKTNVQKPKKIIGENESGLGTSQTVTPCADSKKPKERLKVEWPVSKEPLIDRKDGDCEIKRLNLDKLNNDEIVFASNDLVSSRAKAFEVPRDSFFLGGVDPSSDEEEEPKERKQKEKFQHSDRPHSNADKSFQKRSTVAEKKANKFANNTPLGKPRKFGGAPQQREQALPAIPDAGTSTTEQIDETNLHPSWQAKRKQQVSLTAFQGKKIKFDDE